MGRNTTADKTPLLENDEQNIGNSTYIQPQAGNFGTVIPQVLDKRLLNLQGGSAAGQTTTVVMTARRLIGGAEQNPYPGVAGPITGVAEFGNGGRSTRVEFDVPLGPFVGDFDKAASSLEPQDGGVIITLPTSVLRVFARYDNLLLAPLLNTNPPLSLAQSAGQPVYGPGGPVPPPPPARIGPEPMLVQAMSAYFSRPAAKVYKTLYCYVGGLAIGLPLFTCFALPAFAKTVQVMRFPQTADLDVYLRTGTQRLEQFRVAGGASSPIVPVVGHECIIEINSVDIVTDQVTFLAVVCEIGI